MVYLEPVWQKCIYPSCPFLNPNILRRYALFFETRSSSRLARILTILGHGVPEDSSRESLHKPSMIGGQNPDFPGFPNKNSPRCKWTDQGGVEPPKTPCQVLERLCKVRHTHRATGPLCHDRTALAPVGFLSQITDETASKCLKYPPAKQHILATRLKDCFPDLSLASTLGLTPKPNAMTWWHWSWDMIWKWWLPWVQMVHSNGFQWVPILRPRCLSQPARAHEFHPPGPQLPTSCKHFCRSYSSSPAHGRRHKGYPLVN